MEPDATNTADQQMINVHPFSMTTTRLSLRRGELEVAVGSGFLWRHGNQRCIVTAWHNLTGTHPETGRSLSPTGARPDNVVAALLSSRTDYAVSYSYDLYDRDGQPAWIIHPLGSAQVDLAFFPLNNITEDFASRPANDVEQAQLTLTAGSDLFILGYPRDLSRLGLPIWKRASLAIDPDAILNEAGHRHLLVDTATREGLSGGLAIASGYGIYSLAGGGMSMGNGATKVVGVYTGRIASSDELAAQIGMVWPIRYVEEMMQSGRRDTFGS